MPSTTTLRARCLAPAPLVVLVISLLCLALAGCGSRTPSPPETTPSVTPAPGTSPGSSPDLGSAGTSVENAEIVEDLKGAIASAEQYWAAQFAADGGTFRPVRRVYAYTPGDGSTCGGHPNLPRNASYCRPNDDIAFDVGWTAQAYRSLGDAFVYYLLGHEYAHAIQARLGTALDYTIEYELQADCYAGAYLGDQIRAGVLTIEDGDIEELKAGLRAVADPEGTPWFDPRAHGTAEQRIRFFGRGFDDSVDACP